MLSLAWEQLVNGDVVNQAVKKTDEQYFGGIPVAENLGVGETISGAINGANSAVNGDVSGIGKSLVIVAAGRLKPVAKAIKKALHNKKTRNVLVSDGKKVSMRGASTPRKTGTLDTRDADRRFFESLEKIDSTGAPNPKTRFQKIVDTVRLLFDSFGKQD